MQPHGVNVDLLLPHVLDHPDAGDRVERPVGHLAVVGHADLDPVGHAGLANPFAGQLSLTLGERDPDRAHAVVAGGVDHEAPPPAPDVEHALALAQAELLADQLDLGLLGLLERLGAAGEVGAAVGHRAVEEQREEVVADVVVVADGAPVARDRVPLPAEPQLGGRDRRRDGRARRRGSPRPRGPPAGRARGPAARTRPPSAAPPPGRRRRSSPRRRRGRGRARRAPAGRGRAPAACAASASARRARWPPPRFRPRSARRTAGAAGSWSAHAGAEPSGRTPPPRLTGRLRPAPCCPGARGSPARRPRPGRSSPAA